MTRLLELVGNALQGLYCQIQNSILQTKIL